MGSKQLGSKFLKRSQICSPTPSALNAGAKRSGATCHMGMPQCCYLAKEAKRPSHTTNTINFDRIPFDPCNLIKRFDLCPFDQKNSTYLQPPGKNHLCFSINQSTLIVYWHQLSPYNNTVFFFSLSLCLTVTIQSAESKT